MRTDSTTYYIIDRNNELALRDDSLFRSGLFFNSNDIDRENVYLSLDTTASVLPSTKYREEKPSGNAGIERLFSLEQVDGVFALLLLCFVFLTHIYKGGILFFKENSRLVFSSRENINMFSETTVTEFWYNFILIFQFFLLSAIVLFAFFLEVDSSYIPPNSFLVIILFILSIFLFEGLKFLFYRFIGFLFNIQNVIHIWLRSYMVVIEMMGLVAFIPVLMLVYSNHYHNLLMIFFVILFILSRLIIFYRIIIFFLRENVNFLYCIAYLCSVEIIPYFLLYKGLAYLYKIDIINLLWL